MTMHRLRYYVEGRLIEWVNSLSFVVLSVFLFVWPDITTAPAFNLFAWLLPHQLIGVFFFVCGTSCIVALLVNGNSHAIGPRVRAWSALARSALLLQFGLSTIQASVGQDFPFTVTPFWFLYAFAEIWVAYRAVLDVRIPD